MDMTMSGTGKVVILAVILAIFAVVGWRMGAPESFQAVLADAGIAHPAPPPAAPAPTLVPGAPAQDPAPQSPQSPAPDSSGSSASH